MTTTAKAEITPSTPQQPLPYRDIIPTTIREYKEPSRRSAPTTPTTTTGRRGGCTGHLKTSLTALAPRQHVGHTRSRHPTFSWYVPDTGNFAMEFQLYKLSSAETYEKILEMPLQSTHGFMQFSLPASQPSLEVGQRYLWKVIQFCEGPDRPSSTLITQAEMDVVGYPATSVMTQLSYMLRPPSERAKIEANQGLWYDAISKVLYPKNSTALDLRNQLFQDVDLEFEDSQHTQIHNNSVQ